MSVPRFYHADPRPSADRRYLGSGLFTCHRNYDLEAVVIATKRRLANRELRVREG
ncbi:MAG: hypothetical protein JWL96_1186 [Sphingomonas bacterium]|nr:hypothetical protein [Sphingomonas bacterium]